MTSCVHIETVKYIKPFNFTVCNFYNVHYQTKQVAVGLVKPIIHFYSALYCFDKTVKLRFLYFYLKLFFVHFYNKNVCPYPSLNVLLLYSLSPCCHLLARVLQASRHDSTVILSQVW